MGLLLLCAAALINGCMSELIIVPRDDWKARPPVAIEIMPSPVPYVLIHHSYIPAACTTEDDCIEAMKTMQDMHQLQRGWNDIGYSFAAGGDGRIYEGRGWTHVGAHAPGYNNRSIGICTIGDWREDLPPQNQLDAIQALIEFGVQNGYIAANYQLLGHRQARDTECPGDRLFQEIQTWPNFSNQPVIGQGDTKDNIAAGGKGNFFFFTKNS